MQVSAVSDQLGMEDIGVNPGELDDDEGGGLVGEQTSFVIFLLQSSRVSTGFGSNLIHFYKNVIVVLLLFLQSLNARSRALLMQKLDRSGSTTR